MAIRKNLKNEILATFDQQRSVYADLANTVAQLLQTVLTDDGIVLHTITSRCKDRHSLVGKLNRLGKAYNTLEDITDIAGIRLTTYFADDVNRVAEVLRHELNVDGNASIDKRVQSNPDRFGYLSLHYVAQLTNDRVQLREYRRYANLRFEIQIRSILQHAWAEIEHDLGYKSASGIPSEIRRRFARVSSLLELADSEFSGIREQLNSYEKALPERIESKPMASLIDLPTLRLLVEKDLDIIQLDNGVAAATGATVDGIDSDALSGMVDKLSFFDITTVDQLKIIAMENAENVRKFARYWVEEGLTDVKTGIGLFYLCYVLAWKSGSREKTIAYLDNSNIDSEHNRHALSAEILAFRPEAGTNNSFNPMPLRGTG